MDLKYHTILLEDLINQEIIVKRRFILYEHQLLILEMIKKELINSDSYNFPEDLSLKLRSLEKFMINDIKELLIILSDLVRFNYSRKPNK